MLVFVTGAAGFIGTAVVKELLAHGHKVLGLSRSAANAEKLKALGAEIHEGSLDDSESLSAGAAKADGVIHLAFKHDFENFVANCELDWRVIEALGKPLVGTGKPFIVTNGTLPIAKKPGVADWDVPVTEDVVLPPLAEGEHPLRRKSEDLALAFAKQGVRSAIVRLPPTVHGDGDQAFVPLIIAKSREKGFVGTIGDGKNVWATVHRDDAAVVFRLALESGTAGGIHHGIAEEGVPVSSILDSIARQLGVEKRPVKPEDFGDYGVLPLFLPLQNPVSSKKTQELLGWKPKRVGLIEDLESDAYDVATAKSW
ncbi:hypothetical protein JCM10908_005663 [Rhodotorula pacifica]|uniref:SDR family oxidoreductase n=1 Tax=Rhodotorula pacifica TaxID=1495444 RepID=UPI00316F6821